MHNKFLGVFTVIIAFVGVALWLGAAQAQGGDCNSFCDNQCAALQTCGDSEPCRQGAREYYNDNKGSCTCDCF